MKSFKIQIATEDLDDLHKRLADLRWPDHSDEEGWEQGIPVNYLKKLTSYWATAFDWRKQEDRLNQYPQFIAEIDGQSIHYIHIKAEKPDAMPLLLIHGWPGSFADFIPVIKPLTAPGAVDQLAFDLVIPSIPGFTFSKPVNDTGWNMLRMAAAFKDLMGKLGYERYGVHGGDMGAGITGMLSGMAANELIGTHISSDFFSVAGLGMYPADDSDLSPEEKSSLDRMKTHQKNGTAYLDIQATRPSTIGVALTDSPLAQLAWMAEKYKEWSNVSADQPEGAIGMDQLLTNVSLYWFTKTGASAAKILAENMSMAFNWGGDATAAADWVLPAVPSATACFGKEEDESLLRKLSSLMGTPARYTYYTRGGHFPAMEAPDLLASDIRAFYTDILRS